MTMVLTSTLWAMVCVQVLVPLQVGLALFIAHLTLLPYTFCSTNPGTHYGSSQHPSPPPMGLSSQTHAPPLVSDAPTRRSCHSQ